MAAMSSGLPGTRSWEPRAAPPELGPDHIHVWFARLDPPPRPVSASTLSADERERAAQFRDRVARARFVASRAILRTLLAAYLDLPPGAIGLSPCDGTKPEIRDPAGTTLRFNLSHAGDGVLIAVAAGREIGVDLEELRPVHALDRLARRVLTPGEAAFQSRVEPADRVRVFLGIWTRKEAYAKARGLGIFRADFRHTELGATGPGWLTVRDPDGRPWSVVSLAPPAPSFVAALATEGLGADVSCFTF